MRCRLLLKTGMSNRRLQRRLQTEVEPNVMKESIMKTGDEQLVEVMCYEYRLLFQAYKEFHYFRFINKNDSDNEVKLHLYNCYAKIILHMYEFLKSCVARTVSKTKSEDNEYVKSFIISEVKRISKANGQPTDDAKIEDFSENLRIYRNKVYGHVVKGRLDDFPLAIFYQKYHAYIMLLFQNTVYWWDTEPSEIASNSSIKKFSELLASEP
jgi:hypothetical protein